MDVEGILSAKDDILTEMGLSSTGDRLSLKAFCVNERKGGKRELLNAIHEDQKNCTKERKRQLLEKVRAKTKSNTTSQRNIAKKQTHHHLDKHGKVKYRMVQLGWKHYTNGEYKQVSLKKGGGIRFLNLPLSMKKFELMNTSKEMFFPNGKSTEGKQEEMEFSLSNFQDEVVDVTITVKGQVLPFNLENYIDAYKVRNVRLYLLSRKVHDYSEEDQDNFLSFDELIKQNTVLIGSSEE